MATGHERHRLSNRGGRVFTHPGPVAYGSKILRRDDRRAERSGIPAVGSDRDRRDYQFGSVTRGPTTSNSAGNAGRNSSCDGVAVEGTNGKGSVDGDS